MQQIKPEFADLLPHTQGSNFAINNKSQKTEGVSDIYDNIKVGDFINEWGNFISLTPFKWWDK